MEPLFPENPASWDIGEWTKYVISNLDVRFWGCGIVCAYDVQMCV